MAVAQNELNVQGFLQGGRVVRYPLARRVWLWGLLGGVGAAVFLASPLAGLAVFTLFLVCGVLWRRDEPPVLAFCIAMQWLSVVSGYFFREATGSYPQGFPSSIGDLEFAILMSLLGLTAVASGIRAGLALLDLAAQKLHRGPRAERYDVRWLFWAVIVVHTVNWFVEIVPMAYFFDASQVIYNILGFRTVILCLLLLTVIEQREGYWYAAVAFLFVLVPLFASRMSDFKEIFVLLLVVLLKEWRIWAGTAAEREWSIRVGWMSAGLATAILIMALVWVGAVKSSWRSTVAAEAAESSTPVDKLNKFAETVETTLPGLDLAVAVDTLAGRLSTGISYFSIILDRVPAVLPHEGGALTVRALQQASMPRILFPEKPLLGSSSWMVRKYVGIAAAGDETQTSIGISYVAELYIDFGPVWMFAGLLICGLVPGLIYGAFYLISPSNRIASCAATVLFLQHLVGFDGEFAKLLGGMIQTFLIFALCLLLSGPWLHRRLSASPVGGANEQS